MVQEEQRMLCVILVKIQIYSLYVYFNPHHCDLTNRLVAVGWKEDTLALPQREHSDKFCMS